MCVYIIAEDLTIDKHIFDENNGLWYELIEDYYFPCLTEKNSRSACGVSGTGGISKNDAQPFITLCC